MNNWIGHAISMASILVTVFVGAMWLGALSTKVDNLKENTVSDGRMQRLEQKVETLGDNTRALNQSVGELVREIKRNPN